MMFSLEDAIRRTPVGGGIGDICEALVTTQHPDNLVSFQVMWHAPRAFSQQASCCEVRGVCPTCLLVVLSTFTHMTRRYRMCNRTLVGGMESIVERLESVRFGDEIKYQRFRFVPLVAPSLAEPEYRLVTDSWMEEVKIEEVSQSGMVDRIRVVNKSPHRILLLDGQQLVGAKQNRVMNTDVLIPAKTTLEVPVSCVEQGRWHHKSSTFVPSGISPRRVRLRKTDSVRASLARDSGHRSDQGEVWNEVRSLLEENQEHSPTEAVTDLMESKKQEFKAARDVVVPAMPKDAVGLICLDHGRLLAVEMFDKVSTFRAVLPSLVDSYVADWSRGRRKEDKHAHAMMGVDYFMRILRQLSSKRWADHDSPGEGRDWRFDNKRITASALKWKDTPVHVQVFTKEPEDRPQRLHDSDVIDAEYEEVTIRRNRHRPRG
jgi:ARG/rhodanese/phosphatase superfamily protein